MARARSPLQVLKEAKQIALDHGCYVADKSGRYHVYRETPTGPAWQGQCARPQALRDLVCKLTNFK